MQITLKLILDELGYEYDSYVEEAANPTFSCAELLAPRSSDLSGQKLLVCTLSEALAAERRSGALCFLCIRDRMVDALETPETMRGMVVLRRNLELRELFNEVQRIFVRISSWIIDMQRSLIENEGIQALITMSEAIIGNHIAVMDPTFKLLAYTKHVKTDDPVTNTLVQYGYHPEATVERFKLYRRFEQYEQANGIIVSDDFATSEYVTVKKVFRYRDSYSALAVMVCCHRKLSDGLLDLFQMLMKHIKLYVDRDYPPEGEDSPARTLICDLLDHPELSEGEARSRASYAGLAFQSVYDLFLIRFDDDLNVPLSRLTRALSSLLHAAHVLPYRREILVLNRYEGARLPTRETRLDHVNTVLTGLAAHCGISTRFLTLRELLAAYGQAADAIQMGLQLRRQKTVYTEIPDHGDMFFFEDYALFRFLASFLGSTSDGHQNTILFRAIQTLEEYEKHHHISCLRILHTYLQCDRRATETCSRLHMHRNTVLYQIGRMEEILGLSLDDPEIRLKLMLGFKCKELEETHKNS